MEKLHEEIDDDLIVDKPIQVSYLQLALIFLKFGFLAYGGPAAQIAMLKAELVDERKWCSTARFKKVFAVYQILPGPEATELCCYFGLIIKGRLGAFISGLCFVLPGFIMTLFLSWLYVEYGLSNKTVQASFSAIQVAISALVLRATHRLANDAFATEVNGEDKFSYALFIAGLATALQAVLGVNFLLSLFIGGLCYSFFVFGSEELHTGDKRKALVWLALALVAASLFIVFHVLVYLIWGWSPSEMSSLGSGIVSDNSLWQLFLLGLLAGLVTVCFIRHR